MWRSARPRSSRWWWPAATSGRWTTPAWCAACRTTRPRPGPRCASPPAARSWPPPRTARPSTWPTPRRAWSTGSTRCRVRPTPSAASTSPPASRRRQGGERRERRRGAGDAPDRLLRWRERRVGAVPRPVRLVAVEGRLATEVGKVDLPVAVVVHPVGARRQRVHAAPLVHVAGVGAAGVGEVDQAVPVVVDAVGSRRHDVGLVLVG